MPYAIVVPAEGDPYEVGRDLGYAGLPEAMKKQVQEELWVDVKARTRNGELIEFSTPGILLPPSWLHYDREDNVVRTVLTACGAFASTRYEAIVATGISHLHLTKVYVLEPTSLEGNVFFAELLAEHGLDVTGDEQS